jgi:hypothetical protein
VKRFIVRAIEPLPSKCEWGNWKVRFVRLLGLNCPVFSFYFSWYCWFCPTCLGFSHWQNSEIWTDGLIILGKYFFKSVQMPLLLGFSVQEFYLKYSKFFKNFAKLGNWKIIVVWKSEVGFCVGWSEWKRTKCRSRTEHSEWYFVLAK